MLMFFRLGFSADILKRRLYTNRKVHFSHLSQLGIGYQLWCYHYWEIWGYDLFVEKSHWKPGFQQHNSGFERSSVQLLICMICSFHCLDRRIFFSCCFRKTEYLHPKKAGILVHFVILFQLLIENGLPRTYKNTFECDYCHSHPSLSSLISWLTWKIISSCICVCSTLLTFSKTMLTFICYELKLSRDILLVNNKL